MKTSMVALEKCSTFYPAAILSIFYVKRRELLKKPNYLCLCYNFTAL